MRAKNFLALAAAFVLATAALAQTSGEAKAKSEPKAGAGAPIFMPAGDLKWTDLDASGAPGVKIADVWGNHAKGAYGAFIRFPAGFSAPLHTHTNAAKILVVSGTFIQAPEGKPEVRLGPGSYLAQPGGNYRHTTGCDRTSECLVFVEGSGKFDLKPVKAATTVAEPPASKPLQPSEAAPETARAVATPAASASNVGDPGGQIAVAATRTGLSRIGAEKCQICHKVQFASWLESSHAKRKPPLDCEGCHGPGSEYKSLANMRDPVKARAAGLVIPTAAFCARCHTRGWKEDMLRNAHAHKPTVASSGSAPSERAGE